jgi:ring-1,2-phenylacetyl-CoA epoxidase subunit PaaC
VNGSAPPDRGIEEAGSLGAETRERLRNLLLCLADNKRLLGIRYSDCMLGSPSLETGIAASSMAQDEWGHSRLTYALLGEFGEDAKRLEHERAAEDYSSMELLDRPLGGWTEMIGAALLIDGALTVQYEALRESRFRPVRNRVQKLLEEEVLHQQYAAGWVHRLARSSLAGELAQALSAMLPAVLVWFGPPTAGDRDVLVRDGVLAGGPDELRGRFLKRVAPTLHAAGLAATTRLHPAGEGWRWEGDLGWNAWDARRRRSTGGGPDEETIARVRGDRNRAMLLE